MIKHGSILGGTICTEKFETSLHDYEKTLGLELIETRTISNDFANYLGAPKLEQSRLAILRSKSRNNCFFRLIEQKSHVDFIPRKSLGWSAFEINVQNVFDWPKKLDQSSFKVLGEPKKIPGFDYFIPMQIIGAAGEVLYLNEVLADMPNTDLPKAQSEIDKIFIAILAASDIMQTSAWFEETAQLDKADKFTINYTTINSAFDLADGTLTDLQMIQKGRLPILEIDGYPRLTVKRPIENGYLPQANSIVSLAVDSIEKSSLCNQTYFDFFEYCGRKSAITTGLNGEKLELIEIG